MDTAGRLGYTCSRMKTRAPFLGLLAVPALLAVSPLYAETVLLKDGRRLHGEIVITYGKGVLFREKPTAPGRYYPYEEVARISTEDSLLHYLMPRGNDHRPKAGGGFFPLARALAPRGNRAALIPVVELPKGTPVRVACAGARDAATIEIRGGGAVRLLGIAPPPGAAGKSLAVKAARYLSSRVKGREVLLYPGPQCPGGPGTPEAYAVLDGALLNAEMLERGWARVSPLPAAHRYRAAFDSLQRYARNFGFGFWAAGATGAEG